MTLPLFATEEDVCARKHGGQPESVEAFTRGDREADREKVYAFLAAQGDEGATLDEVSLAFGRTPNAISGRFTDLHEAHRIYRKPGVFRNTRTDSRAAVWVAR